MSLIAMISSQAMANAKCYGQSPHRAPSLDDVLAQTMRQPIPIEQVIQQTEERKRVVLRHGGYMLMAFSEVPLEMKGCPRMTTCIDLPRQLDSEYRAAPDEPALEAAPIYKSVFYVPTGTLNVQPVYGQLFTRQELPLNGKLYVNCYFYKCSWFWDRELPSQHSIFSGCVHE